MILTNKVARIAVASCMAAAIGASTMTYAVQGVQAKDSQPKPPPKKLESVLKGDKPEPKPTPKNELYLIESSGGSYLINRSQLNSLGKPPPDCKVKCAAITTIDGKRLAVPQAALSSFKLSPQAGGYFKESTKRFGVNTASWPPPISPDIAKEIHGGATVQLVPAQF
jgi:hypothetical protein